MQVLRCPVCRASMRESRACGRCGVDLTEVQRVAVAAWRARRRGWAALMQGDAAAALAHATEARSLQDDAANDRLAWLARVASAAADAGAAEGAAGERPAHGLVAGDEAALDQGPNSRTAAS